MEWKAITPDELKGLKLAGARSNGHDYGPLFEAVAKGPVRIDVEPEKLQSLKWSLSRAIKKAQIKIIVATLADKTGVVLSMATEDTKKK